MSTVGVVSMDLRTECQALMQDGRGERFADALATAGWPTGSASDGDGSRAGWRMKRASAVTRLPAHTASATSLETIDEPPC